MDQPIELQVPDAGAWRRWLEQHHTYEPGVWLVLGRARGPGLRHAAALEEALAFGWIDGQARGRDETTWFIRFTPRRRASRWSKRNTQLAERLAAEGRLHPAGLAEIERAKADGRWAAAYAGAATIEVPTDLAAALAASPRARENFGRLTAQNRYAILYRLHDAKRAETRRRRLEAYLAMLERGETLYPQRAPLVT